MVAMERSMPPMATTKVKPSARTMIKDESASIPRMFCALKKTGDRSVKMTERTISAMGAVQSAQKPALPSNRRSRVPTPDGASDSWLRVFIGICLYSSSSKRISKNESQSGATVPEIICTQPDRSSSLNFIFGDATPRNDPLARVGLTKTRSLEKRSSVYLESTDIIERHSSSQ